MSDILEVRMPHFGEGMRYARVSNILKKVGEPVTEDGNILVVETDKSAIEITSPIAGFISDILCEAGQIVNVGEVMLRISIRANDGAPLPSRQWQQRRRFESVRTPEPATAPQETIALPDKQVALIHAMKKSQEQVVTANLSTNIDWGTLQGTRKTLRACLAGSDVPSSLEMIIWAVAEAMFKYHKFRSRVIEQDRLCIAQEAKIGLAVAQEEDTLGVSTITMRPADTFSCTRRAIKGAGEKLDNLSSHPDYHSLVISDMSSLGILDAQPVVIAPAVATLFIGAPYWSLHAKHHERRCQYSNLVLAFDHRVMNGAYGALFLNQVKKNLNYLINQAPSFFLEGMKGIQQKRG